MIVNYNISPARTLATRSAAVSIQGNVPDPRVYLAHTISSILADRVSPAHAHSPGLKKMNRHWSCSQCYGSGKSSSVEFHFSDDLLGGLKA